MEQLWIKDMSSHVLIEVSGLHSVVYSSFFKLCSVLAEGEAAQSILEQQAWEVIK